MYLTSSDYEIMHDGGEQVVGIVFPSVSIPSSAYITEARVIFDVDESTAARRRAGDDDRALLDRGAGRQEGDDVRDIDCARRRAHRGGR